MGKIRLGSCPVSLKALTTLATLDFVIFKSLAISRVVLPDLDSATMADLDSMVRFGAMITNYNVENELLRIFSKIAWESVSRIEFELELKFRKNPAMGNCTMIKNSLAI